MPASHAIVAVPAPHDLESFVDADTAAHVPQIARSRKPRQLRSSSSRSPVRRPIQGVAFRIERCPQSLLRLFRLFARCSPHLVAHSPPMNWPTFST
jgi:hypothetical protein